MKKIKTLTQKEALPKETTKVYSWIHQPEGRPAHAL